MRKTVPTGLVLAATLVAGGCARTPAPGPKPPVTVTAAAVEKSDVVVEAVLPGTVQPARTARLLAQVEGEVLALSKREGDPVQEGEVLVEVDPSRLAAALEEAEAQRDLVSVQLDSARKVLARDQALYGRHGLGQEALERSQTNVATLEAELRMAEGRAAAIRAQLDDARVRAPFDGYVLERWVELGDVVGVRSPLLSVASEELVVAARVSELDLLSAEVGVEVGLAADAVRTRVSRAGCKGVVRRVYPRVDPATRAATVEIRPEQQCAAHLRPGMFVRVALVKARRSGVLVIPGDAIVVGPDGSAVTYVVDGSLARRRSVETGLEGQNVLEILSGLEEGEQVIVLGQERLKDGTPVELAGARGGASEKPGTTAGGTL